MKHVVELDLSLVGRPVDVGRQMVKKTLFVLMPQICQTITHPGEQAQVALGAVSESLGLLVTHTSAASAAATLRTLADLLEKMPATIEAAATGRPAGKGS